MKTFALALTLSLLPFLAFGQSEKQLRKNSVAKKTTYEYFLSEGKNEPVVEEIETYDEEGNVTELKVFNKSGDIKQWEAYKYDEHGDVTEEKYFDQRGQVVERVTYTYVNRLVREKKYYDQRNRLVKKKTYEYEFRKEEE